MNLPQVLAAGVQLHQGGRLAEAEQMYRRILAQEPNHPDALHLLGVVALQLGQRDSALQLIQRAIALRPGDAQYQNNLGNVLLSMGKFADAETVFRRALEINPGYAEARYNLGLALHRQGRIELAVAAYRTALGLKPDYADAWHNLGNALLQQGQLEPATAAFRSALRFKPHAAELHYKLGNALLDQGRWKEAVAAFSTAVQLRPDYAEAYYNAGIAWHHQQEFEAAKGAYRTAITLQPDHVEAHCNLGKALLDERQIQPAIDAFRAALAINPNHPETLYNLGNAFLHQNLRQEALDAYRAAVRHKPNFPEAQNNMGNLLQLLDESDAAIASYLAALVAKPDFADACNNLGSTYKNQGRLDDAIQAYRRAMDLQPEDAGFQSNYVYMLLFHPGYDARAIREEHARWNQRHAVPLRPARKPHSHAQHATRRLTIGYVSADFRDHVVGRNLVPLLAHHDHELFKIICYSGTARSDGITERFRKFADVWRETLGVRDEMLTEQIERDEVDVLVDLSLHMACNRLTVFARHPAPVQVTFGGYPGSTGVETIRYRLTDPLLDPPGLTDPLYSEESIRLPHTFWCFDPLEEVLEINDLPALSENCVTFGCFNNFCKVNERVLALWARVLGAVQKSRLLLLAPLGSRRDEILEFFRSKGVDSSRLEFVSKGPRREYLEWHTRVDMILDTFPYNGHTTSLDALWMGVPVVSLAGEHAVSRAGFSQLSNLGLEELVAFSEDDYVNIAQRLAQDLPRLAALRTTLRTRMGASPLMDAPRFARDIEAAYREMWRRWCAAATP